MQLGGRRAIPFIANRRITRIIHVLLRPIAFVLRVVTVCYEIAVIHSFDTECTFFVQLYAVCVSNHAPVCTNARAPAHVGHPPRIRGTYPSVALRSVCRRSSVCLDHARPAVKIKNEEPSTTLKVTYACSSSPPCHLRCGGQEAQSFFPLTVAETPTVRRIIDAFEGVSKVLATFKRHAKKLPPGRRPSFRSKQLSSYWRQN